MEDSVEGYSSDSTQASTFMIDKAMLDSPAQTAGRRGRHKNSAGRSSARPRGGGRKSTAASTRAGGSARGRSRRGRAAATASRAFAASASPKVRHGGHGKAETAEEMALELITEESESRIDVLAEEYVSKITPDPSTTIYADQNSESSANAPGSSSYPVYDSSQAEPPAMPSQKRRSGRPGRSAPVQRRRRVAIEGDERVVSKPQMGRWSSLLPVGTVVRRPSTKLVQLVAQAIHESPLHVLRVTHVYAALQNRYPYYKLLDNRGINSWKSSVRHALFQKWFVKLCPRSKMSDSLRSKSYFWGLNYNLRPREWVMPQPQATAFSFPVQGGAGHGEDDEDASLLLSRMHLDNEPPKMAVASSTFQPELQEGIFSPPETKTLSGRKRRRGTAARASSGGRPSVPPPPVDELAALSSSSPVYHTHLWETDLKTDIKLDSWPEPFQESMSSAASAATSAVAAMKSPAATFVEAAEDGFQSSQQSLSGKQLPPLHQEEQLQQTTLMAQQATTQQSQQQQMLEELPQGSPGFQQTMSEFVTTPTAGQAMDWFRSDERERPPSPLDDKFSIFGSPKGEDGALTLSSDWQFSPQSILSSPPHLTQLPWSPGHVASPLSDAQTTLLTPKPEDENVIQPLATMPMQCLDSLMTTLGLPQADYMGGAAAGLRMPLPEWQRMKNRKGVKKNVSQGTWIGGIMMLAPLTRKPGESPTHSADGDDSDECDDEDILPSEEEDSCLVPAPADPYGWPPAELGDRSKLEPASTPESFGIASSLFEST